MKGLADRPRSGRPPVFAATVVAEVKALACCAAGRARAAAVALVVLRTWPVRPSPAASPTVAVRVDGAAAGWPPMRSSRGSTGPGSSPATRTSPPRPHGCWTSTTGVWDGRRLRPDEYVISADEKSQLQALRRRHDDLPPGPGTDPPGRVRVPPRRHPGLPRGARRPPRHRDRPVRSHHRDRPVQRARRAGHDPRALRLGAAGVLGRRQRLLPRRASLGRPDARGLAHRRARPPADPRLLAQPDRDLLLHRATQGHQARQLRRPRPPSSSDCSPSKLGTTRPRVLRLALHQGRPQRLPRPTRPPTSHSAPPPDPRRTNADDH